MSNITSKETKELCLLYENETFQREKQHARKTDLSVFKRAYLSFKST